jgi:hypothetical protein
MSDLTAHLRCQSGPRTTRARPNSATVSMLAERAGRNPDHVPGG